MRQYILLFLILLPFFAFSQGTNKDTVKVLPFDSLSSIGWTSLDTADQIFIYDSQTQTFAYRITWGQLLRGVDTAYLATKRYVDSSEITFKDIMALGTDYLADGGDSTDFKVTNADQIVLNSNGTIQLFTDSFNLNLIAQLGTIRMQGGSYRMIGLDEASATESDTLVGLLGITSVNDSVELFKFSDLMFDFVGDSVLVDTSYFASKEYVNTSISSSPGLDSLIQSGKTFTFYAGDSTYSMQSVDTLYIDGSSYKLVVGTDTFTVAGITDLGDVYYVAPDGEGNNATAQVGNPNLPWADLGAAIDSSGGSGTIYVLAGTHTFTFKNMAGIPLNMYMEAGATINATNFFTGIDTTLIISGSGNVVASNSLFTFSDNYNSYSYASFQSLDVTSLNISDRITLDNDTTGGFFLNVENLNVNNTFVFAGSNTDALKDFTFFFNANRVTATITSGEEIFFKVGDIENSDFFFNIRQMELEGSKDLGILFRPGDSGADKTNMNLVFNIDRGQFWTATSRTSPGAGYVGLALVGIDGTFDSTQVVLNCVFCELNEVMLLGTTVPRTGSVDADFVFRGKYKINRNYAASYTVNWTQSTTNVNAIFEGDFTVDSVFYRNINDRNSNVIIRNSEVKTLSNNSPIMQIKSNIYGTNEIRNSKLIYGTNATPISGASGTILLSGDVILSYDSLDTDITYTRKRNLGSNSIADRLAFGAYTIDADSNTLSITNLDDLNLVAGDAIAIAAGRLNTFGNSATAGSNTILLADSLITLESSYLQVGNSPTVHADMSPSATDDDIDYVFVQNANGLLKKSARLLYYSDTLTMTGATDTFDLDYRMDVDLAMDATSASATTTITILNPSYGTTLDFSFINVGSTITVNFSHKDRSDHTAQSSFQVTADGDKIFRYKPDGSWWSTQ